MSWSALSNNQNVSKENLNNAVSNSVFVLKNSFTSNKLMLTKARAQSYVYLDENHTSFLNKSNNQLVTKQDLVAANIGSCGSVSYKKIVWVANTLTVTTAYFDLGTTDGTVTLDYLVNGSSSASLMIYYGGDENNAVGITPIVNSNGSVSFYYQYNSSLGSIVAVTFAARQGSSITHDFDVRVSCPVPPPPTSTGWDIRASNDIFDICTQTPFVVYSDAADTVFTTGVQLYTNDSLTNSLSGFDYVVLESSGNIFFYNNSTGTIGADTNIIC